jgi:CubicO group peptidase (beta-lactamase class C family)
MASMQARPQRLLRAGLLCTLLACAGPLRADPLDDVVHQAMDNGSIPGLSLAVVKNGALVSARAYGRTGLDWFQPIRTWTIFQAGSASQPVSALGALLLARQGRVSLDADVSDGLQSWQVPPNRFTAGHPATLRLILCHSAGFNVRQYNGYPKRWGPLPATPEILAGMPPAHSWPVRVVSMPGRDWHYSEGGYEVMQMLVEDTVGDGFGDFMQETVLGPLGMAHSTYRRPLPEQWHNTAALGHRADGGLIWQGWRLYPEQAAAGLWTTPTDLAQFILAVQGGLAGNGSPIPPSIARAMTTPVRAGDALGLFVTGPQNGIFFMEGQSAGYDTLLYFTRNLGLAVMINRNDTTGALQRIRQAVWAQYQ